MLDPDFFNELKASGQLPSPKGAALKVIELCQRDNATLPEIIQFLQIDPAMVGRILKLANSAAFSRPRPVVALTPDVLMSIGIHSVRQIVLAFSLVSNYRQGQCPGFDYEMFWSRSAATGVATQLLGAATRAAPPAEMFNVGLLAHVGRLALAALHPARYGELLTQAGGQFAAALTPLERQAFGHTHLDIAAAMMRDWGLPGLFADAVLFHEAPELAEFGAGTRGARLVANLHLGEQLAALCFAPPPERKEGFAKLLPLAHEFGIEDGDLATLGDRMLREWKDWSAMLELTVHEVAPFSTLQSVAGTSDPLAAEAPARLDILVVDHDPTACLLLQKLLAAAGHAVRVARDSQAGLVQALQFQPQVVITDLMMPRNDGLQLIRSLRQTESGRLVYIVALTGDEDEDTLAAALNAGADDYLTKPVATRPLLARLNSGMRMIREREALRREQDALRRRLQEISAGEQGLGESLRGDARADAAIAVTPPSN